jgi:glyoxylase-like metal-dependent hydrolase (beta-lactamase superfamily II)
MVNLPSRAGVSLLAMTNLTWQIGSVRITRVEESLSPFPYDGLLPELSQEDWRRHLDWLRPGFVDDEGNMVLSIHGLVVESQGRTILVDTCMGPHQVEGVPPRDPSPFLENLEAAGFPLDAIDVVLCTHMHFDHVGWNTREVDGRWVPTFPRARYLFARVEWDHWSAQEQPGYAATLDESVRPIVEASRADLVESDHELTDEVWLEATPGHTPGHVAVRIASGGEQAMITGDLTHHPVQWAEAPARHRPRGQRAPGDRHPLRATDLGRDRLPRGRLALSRSVAAAARSWLERRGEALAGSNLGGSVQHRVCSPIDRVLIPLTKGRISLGAPDTLLLTIRHGRATQRPEGRRRPPGSRPDPAPAVARTRSSRALHRCRVGRARARPG